MLEVREPETTMGEESKSAFTKSEKSNDPVIVNGWSKLKHKNTFFTSPPISSPFSISETDLIWEDVALEFL